jgi:hypothetical protein
MKKIVTGRPTCNKLLVLVLAIWTCFYAGLAWSDDPLSACPIVEDEIVDLSMLTIALTNTKAVGVFTKLRLKKDINKLLARFDDWHNGKSKFTLDQLEEQYNLLLMKIAALIHDKDLALHQKLCNAWAEIWLDLKDPEKFSQMNS